MLHAETETLIRLASKRPAPIFRQRPLHEGRKMVRASIVALDTPHESVADVRDFSVPAQDTKLTLRLYRPIRMASDNVLLFLHGGGWTFGDIESHDGLCRTLSNRLGLRVVSADFRLAPEHPFPAGYLDGIAAAEWITSSPAELGEAVSGIVLAGDSSGGNIIAAISAHWPSSIAVRAQFLLYPVLDISARSQSYEEFGTGFMLEADDMEWFISNYSPDPALRTDPRLSPLHGPLDRVPPTVIATAGADILRDEGRAYAARLIQAGIETHFLEADGFVHGWATARAMLPSVVPTLERALACLRGLVAPAISLPDAGSKERNPNV